MSDEPQAASRFRLPVDLACAVASGWIMACSLPLVFPPGSPVAWLPAGWLEPLALFGLVPLLLRLGPASPRRAFALGALTGAAFFLLALYWLDVAMTTFGKMPRLLSIPVLVLLVSFLSLFWGTAVWAAVRLKTQLRIPLVLALPLTWVAMELLRNYALTGFSWANLGYTQARTLWLAQLASLGGVNLVAGAVVLSNAAVTDLLAGARSGAGVPRKTAIGLVVVFTAVGIFGAIRLSQDLEPASAPRLRVAVVQGNLDEKVRIRGAAGQAWVLQRMLEQSREAVAEGARLVVWPEGTLPEPVRPDATALHPLLGSFAALDAELLIGGITREATGSEVKLTNSAFLTDGSLNVKARYDKRHLVPFGEYVPLASILPVHWFVPQGVAFFSPGKDHAPLSAASGKLGVMICYESIFPEIAREAAALGAQLLVVITNDSWYGFTSAPHQHLAIARLRAIETGRNLVRAANCGLSAVIDSRGRVLEVLPLGLVPTAAETPGVQDLLPPARLTATVALHDGKTVYGTIGESFALACAAASVALLLLTFTRFRRRPGSEPPIPSAGN